MITIDYNVISDTYRIIFKDASGPPFSPDIPLVQALQIWTGPNEKNDRPAMVVSLAPVAVEWELHHGPTWQLLQLQNLGRMIKNAGDCQCCGGFPGSSSCVVVAVRQGDKHQPWSRTEAGCFVFCDALVMEVVFPVVPKTFMGRAKLWQTSYGMLWSCEAETQAANV